MLDWPAVRPARFIGHPFQGCLRQMCLCLSAQVHLKRHVLRAWFRTAMQDHRVTVNVRAAQAVEHAKQGLAGQFMGHVEELRCVCCVCAPHVCCSYVCV
eukprot:1141783-Pelagomonas_calceolata.AAC.2